MIHHNSIDPSAPVFYRLGDGLPRFAARAGQLDWRDGPGRIVECAPAVPGPWQARCSHDMPVDPGAIVEVLLADGTRYVERAVCVAWGSIPDEPGAEVQEYRVLIPGAFVRRPHHTRHRVERPARHRQPTRVARAGLDVRRGPAACNADGMPRSRHPEWAYGYASRRQSRTTTPAP